MGMIKLSKYAVRGFVEECYRKGYTEKQATMLMLHSIRTSDALWDKEAVKKKASAGDEWEETTKEEFFKAHPEAKQVYETPSYRKDHKYDAFFDVLDSGKKIHVSKKNPYKFKWDPSISKK